MENSRTGSEGRDYSRPQFRRRPYSDRDYAPDLDRDTPKNRPLIDAGWNAGHARDLYYINKYEVIQPEDRAESLISVLDAVDDHHGIQAEEGGYDGIIVTGLSLTDAVKAKLEKLGFSITSVKADGFTLSGTLQEPVYLRQLRDI